MPKRERIGLWLRTLLRGQSRPVSAPTPPTGDAAPDTRDAPAAVKFYPPPSPRFTGRAQLLAKLQQLLMTGQPTAIVGLGGVGKTQLAAAYADSSREDYDSILWIAADQATTLMQRYAALSSLLNLPSESRPDAEVASVHRWFNDHSKWLVVFDNADSPEDLRPVLPSGEGHIIVTSRNPQWQDFATVSVEIWSREESLAFLRQSGFGDDSAMNQLAEALGDLPLALEQALSYMDETRTSPMEYLALYHEHTSELFSLGQPASYQQTLSSTWSVSLERLRSQAPAARELLNLCAFLSSEDIPRLLISDHADLFPQPLRDYVSDRIQYANMIGVLARYALLSATPETLNVHRLVQAVLRQALSAQDETQWASIAVRLVEQAYPIDSDDVRQWPLCLRLMPHVLVVTEHAELYRVEPSTTALLLDRAATYLQSRAQFREAKQLLERSLSIREHSQGADSPEYAKSLANLGAVLRALGELAAARDAFERALAIQEATYGPRHPEVAGTLNNLGILLTDLGDFSGARTIYERALEIRQATYGPDDPATATSLNNLAIVLHDSGDLSAAQSYYERALTIREAALGTDHPDTATVLGNLGTVKHELGDLAGAKASYEQALRVFERTLGPEHPAVANAINNLATVLSDLGDLEGAESYYERALSIREAALGPSHPEMATVLANLGSVAQGLGKLARAESYYARALEIREETLGPDHPATRQLKERLEVMHRRSKVTSGTEGDQGAESESLRAGGDLATVLQDLEKIPETTAVQERASSIAEPEYSKGGQIDPQDVFGLRRERAIAAKKVRHVFTPHQPISNVELLYGRRHEVRMLIEHMNTPGQHAILYGERGVGKSSLANVVANLFLGSITGGHPYIKRCDSADTFESIVEEPLQDAEPKFGLTQVERQRNRGRKAGLKLPIAEAGLDSAQQVKETYSYNRPLSPSAVAKAMKGLQGILLIDEADAISNPHDHAKLAEMIKHLSDSGASFKVLVVGIAETGEALTAGHPSVQRCLKETRLGRMTDDELRQIVDGGAEKLGLRFESDAIDAIVRLSSGYPHFTHLLALKCAEEAVASGRDTISRDDLPAAMSLAVEDAAGTLRRVYDDAVTSAATEMYRAVVIAAASIGQVEFTAQELRQAVAQRIGRPMSQAALGNYLGRLISWDHGKILRRVATGVYSFDDPRMSSFVRIANELVDS